MLIISHGNADVERKFSINANILTDERTLLSEESIWWHVDFLGNEWVHKVKVRIIDKVSQWILKFLFQMSTTIDMLRAVQKSASLHEEEMLKMKEIAAT